MNLEKKKAARFLEAMEEADRRGPMKIRNISAELRLGEELVVKGHPMSRAENTVKGMVSHIIQERAAPPRPRADDTAPPGTSRLPA